MASTERHDAVKDLLDTVRFQEYDEANPTSPHLHPPSSPVAEMMDDDDSIQLTLDDLQLNTPGKVTDLLFIIR